MNITALLPALTCLLSSVGNKEQVRNYEGAQVIRVSNISENHEGFETLQKLYRTDGLFDLFTTPSRTSPTDVMVCKEEADRVRTILSHYNIPFEVVVQDLSRQISEHESTNKVAVREGGDAMTWTAYHSLTTIHVWMDAMATQYPSVIAVETYGHSYENRPLKVMKISANKDKNNPIVWIDGGIHAREWISAATATFIANQLIDLATMNSSNLLVSSLDWYIAPVLNPDGYEYTSTDRMWRKTRSRNPNSNCFGTDPNRNFAFKWGGQGTSDNPCSETYKGSSPASEKEVSSMQQYILSKREQIKLYISLHSYSQFLFIPWGYDNVALDSDRKDLLPIAEQAANTLESVHGTSYKVGTPGEILYLASGGAFDWVKGEGGIKFSYTFELRDTGSYGFLLPPNQIVPTGQETLEAVKVMVAGMMKYFSFAGW